MAIYVVEGISSVEPQRIEIGDVNLGEGYSIDITGQNRHFLVTFADLLAYQVTDESYTSGNEYEIRSKGVLCRYERSRYLDFIKAQYLIDALCAGQYTHYGLLLEDNIIDVIAEVEPRIEELQIGQFEN